MSFSSWKSSVTPKLANYAPISDTTRIHGSTPNPRVGMMEHLYNNTFSPRCGAYLGFGTYSRLFTLELCNNTTAPYFFLLLFFSFILFFYHGQGTFIRFNFIALGNAIESAAWSIIGGLARSKLFAERRAPVSLEGNNQQSFMRKGSAPKFLAFYVPFLTEKIFLTHTLLKWYLFYMFYIPCILKNRVSIR